MKEQLGKRALALGRVENVLLPDAFPGQGPAAARQRVALVRVFPLSGEQLEARL